MINRIYDLKNLCVLWSVKGICLKYKVYVLRAVFVVLRAVFVVPHSVFVARCRNMHASLMEENL